MSRRGRYSRRWAPRATPRGCEKFVFIMMILLATWNLSGTLPATEVISRVIPKVEWTLTSSDESNREPARRRQAANNNTVRTDVISMESSAKSQYNAPTFLWGIPSIQGEEERRLVIRETYLTFYEDSEEQPNRICSLRDLQAHKVALQDCQMAYTFFFGGNPDGPTELVNPNASFPMLVRDPPTTDENDVIYLNIKENMEDGKSQTWLKYASMVIEEFPFDYVAKADSDTILFTPAFLEFAEKTFPHRPNNIRIYGGDTHGKNSCNPTVIDTHPCPLPLVGDVYAGGALYWMSADLASFVTSDQVDRSKLMIRHEDVDIGNFVFSHPQNVTTTPVNKMGILIHRNVDILWEWHEKGRNFEKVLWGHSEAGFAPGPFFKDVHNYRKTWRQFQVYWLSLSDKKLKIKKDYDLVFKLYDLPDYQHKELIRTNDYIYSNSDFDSSPVVIESHKLIFFTVSGVSDEIWRCFFRRLLGYNDWQNVTRQFEGLRYLQDYNVSRATEMMTSSDYTRAMFVRDPKVRLLSNFLEYVVKDEGEFIRWPCCGGKDACVESYLEFPSFIKKFGDCDEAYFRPQGWKMEPKYYPLLTFVGHYSRMKGDAQRLLRRIGAWEEYGSRGWGPNGEDSIFHNVSVISESLFLRYYSPEIEKAVQNRFKSDYVNSVLNLTRRAVYDTGERSSRVVFNVSTAEQHAGGKGEERKKTRKAKRNE